MLACLQLEYGVCTFTVEGLVVVLDCRSITTAKVWALSLCQLLPSPAAPLAGLDGHQKFAFDPHFPA